MQTVFKLQTLLHTARWLTANNYVLRLQNTRV